jgi:hypothetical protein
MIESLIKYSVKDALAAGLPMPPCSSDPNELAVFMSRAGDVLFLPGDPNYDNQKRNIAIHVFLSFQHTQIIEFCKEWLEKWSQNKSAPWYREWQAIANRADPEELTDILLSHDEERVRQRISSPLGEMLDFETILRIKRATRHEAV